MLESYREKRDFRRTPEPQPGGLKPPGRSLTFVVQKHAARRMHYDVRLEIDGALKSWPVPKGPSLDPEEKRLAVMVEDHPLEYASFEGVIPGGEYGAGQMIVWDAGIYSPDEDGELSFGDHEESQRRMLDGLENGKLSFTLRGRKLRGSWALVKTSRDPQEWLLIKHRDRHADPGRDILLEDKSVLSGLTIADLKAGRLPDSRRPGAGVAAPFPTRPTPMMASSSDRPFSNAKWIFEPKLDGFRALVLKRGGDVRVLSRTGKDMTDRLPSLVEEVSQLQPEELVIDGELVAAGDNGLPDFTLLQRTMGLHRLPGATDSFSETGPVTYYPFDLLYVDGTDVTGLPLIERKALLSRSVLAGDALRLMEYVEADGESFFEAAVRMGIEGMVGKRRDSRYEQGARSPAWLKVKAVQAQEFVVGGYTAGAGARSSTFGALMLGYHDDDGLRYAGRVGSGFDDRTLDEMLPVLERLRADRSPFVDEPELPSGEPVWLKPELVVQVRYAEWRDGGHLRAPVFLHVRRDVEPSAVVRETAALPAAPVPEETRPAAPDPAAHVVEQLDDAGDRAILDVDGHRVAVTNLDKVLWPASAGGRAVTKRDMIRYYVRMGAVLVPHLRDRPLTMTRYPDGVDAESFYQKHWTHDLPDFVETVRLYSSHNEGDQSYVTVNNLATLVWLAQLADIEMHPWLSRTAPDVDGAHLTTDFGGSRERIESSALNHPDFIVFDLDPYIYSGRERKGDEPELNRDAFLKTVEVALALKDILDDLSLSSFLKTSGKTGLHIYLPVLRQYDYKVTRKACETIGRFLMSGRPRDVTMEWSVERRTGKIFLDHNQNVRGKNMASVYSLRPLPRAPVSTPVEWGELENVYPTAFNIDTVPERVERMGDLWAGILESKHDLRRLVGAE